MNFGLHGIVGSLFIPEKFEYFRFFWWKIVASLLSNYFSVLKLNFAVLLLINKVQGEAR